MASETPAAVAEKTSQRSANDEETQPLRISTDADGCHKINDISNDNTDETKHKQSVLDRYCGCPIDVCREIGHQCRKVDCKRILRRTFSLKTLKSRVPIVGWLPKYRLNHLQGDIIAGITVGLTVLPQSLAYAKIAELPPQYGLYTAFMCCFVYALLGTSKDVNIGPAAVMSLLTAEFGHSMIKGDPTYAIALSLVCGVIQIVMGLLHIGFLVEYISHPVINSFTTAAAITIACSQLKKWLGLHGIPRGFIAQLDAVIRKLPQTQLWDFGLGLVCMILLYALKKLKDIKWKNSGESATVAKKVAQKVIWIVSTARNAIIVLAAASVAAVLYHNDQVPFTLTGNITSGIPSFKPPSFTITHENQTYTATDMFQTVGLGIIMVPLIGVIEVIAVGKAFGRKNGYNVDANQELYALGIANVLGSFVSAYPVTASFSRSAVNAQSGSMTTLAGAVTGALVVLALAFLTPLFYYIPDAALAAVIIMAVTDMINFSMLKDLWIINKADLLPWLTAFFVSLGAGFEYGILLGVAVSLLILLYPWARPKITMTPYELTQKSSIDTYDGIIVVEVSMGLMFPGIEHLQEKIMKKAFQKNQRSSVILDFSNVQKIDYSSAVGLDQLTEDFEKQKTWLVFVNVQKSVLDTLTRADVVITQAKSLDDAVRLIRAGDPPDDSLAVHVVAALSEIGLHGSTTVPNTSRRSSLAHRRSRTCSINADV
jgi:sodium-independent sulfate anion transporter 11